MGQVDLAEEKSARIVVDESRCLRAVRGNGAALLFQSLVIDADPEPATDRINFSRRRKRMSPDDILEQPDFADATLNLTCDPIGRLVVAMGIVPPADKEGSGADFPHTISDGANRALGLFAFMGNEAIGETGGKAYPPVSALAPRPLVLLPPRGEPSVGPADRLCCSDASRRRR